MAPKSMYNEVGDNDSMESLLEAQAIPKSTTKKLYHLGSLKFRRLESNVVANPKTTIITFLLCLSVLLNIIAWGRNFSFSAGNHAQVYELEYGKDVRYMSLDHKYDHLWIRISSDHTGLMNYPDPEDPHPGREEAPLGVMSMFHQLHCLSSFRNSLQDAYDGKPVAFDETENKHWPHCLDYLRQAILCNADDTLERERYINGTRTFKIDGTTDKRQCKDRTHLYDALRAHGLPDAKGPLADLEEEESRLDINISDDQ